MEERDRASYGFVYYTSSKRSEDKETSEREYLAAIHIG